MGRAVAIFGVNEARLAILTYLAREPNATRKAVCAATGLSAPSVSVHLRALVAAGALVTEPAEPAPGQHLHYSVCRPVIAEELRHISEELRVEDLI